jgi:hypothetical protein
MAQLETIIALVVGYFVGRWLGPYFFPTMNWLQGIGIPEPFALGVVLLGFLFVWYVPARWLVVNLRRLT